VQLCTGFPMPLNYYYACSLPLEVGSVVLPGNWGRMLRTYTPQCGNPWILSRETVYEIIRLREFPSKPSRFYSIFLCPTEALLNAFCARTNRIFDLKYEVELVDANANSHNGDWTLANLPDNLNIQAIEDRARQYWNGHNLENVEFMTMSAARIVHRLA
jgi:hypothetical protein